MDARDAYPPPPASIALADFYPEALGQQFAAWGYKPSHAARVLRAFYAEGGLVEAEGQGLPQGLMERVRREFASGAATLAVRQVASDGTTKFLLQIGRAHV